MLGLTASEAKAYLAVVKLGLCRVSQIASEGQLQRTEVYRFMPRLVSMGLIQETLDRPKRYRCSTFQDAIDPLTKKIATQLENITRESKQLVAQLESLKSTAETRDQPLVVVIDGIRDARRNFREAVTSAQSEVWMVAGARAMRQVLRLDIAHLSKMAASKNLKVRVVLEVDKMNAKRLMKLPSQVEIRHYQPLFDVHLYAIDDRSLAVGLEPPSEKHPDSVSQLVTTHKPVIGMLREFFNSLWNQAIPLDVRLAMLKSQGRLRGETRILWGRDMIHRQAADWHLRAKGEILDILTRHGPSRVLARFKEALLAARERGVRTRIICSLCRENLAAVKELSTIAEVRDVETPFGMGVAILDESEAMIDYISPDSPDIKASGADVGVYTTSEDIVSDLRHMFEFMWKHSTPIEKQLRKLTGEGSNEVLHP